MYPELVRTAVTARQVAYRDQATRFRLASWFRGARRRPGVTADTTPVVSIAPVLPLFVHDAAPPHAA